MVAVWSALSFAVKGTPTGVPRRLALPNTWNVKDTWTVAKVSLTDCRFQATCLLVDSIIQLLASAEQSTTLWEAVSAAFGD